MGRLNIFSAYEVKISDTVKGVRLDIHIYANNTNEEIQEAFTMYLKAQQTQVNIKTAVENSKITLF